MTIYTQYLTQPGNDNGIDSAYVAMAGGTITNCTFLYNYHVANTNSPNNAAVLFKNSTILYNNDYFGGYDLVGIRAIIKNCIFAWNNAGGYLPTYLGGSGYNCWFANGAVPNSFTDYKEEDPQLNPVSPEFLLPTSPMLNAGEPGAGGIRPNVGAHGVGIIASSASINPSVSFTNFANWFEIISGAKVNVGDTVNGSNFSIVTSGNMLGSLQLNTFASDGVTRLLNGTIYSPVLDTGVPNATLRASYFSEFENLLSPTGSRATIAKYNNTITRVIEYRVSSSPINILDTTIGFQDTTNRAQVNTTGARYIQLRMVFRRDAK